MLCILLEVRQVFLGHQQLQSYSFIVYDIYILYAEKGKREDNERDEKMSTVDERRPREMMTMRDGGDFDCWRIDRLKSSKID